MISNLLASLLLALTHKKVFGWAWFVPISWPSGGTERPTAWRGMAFIQHAVLSALMGICRGPLPCFDNCTKIHRHGHSYKLSHWMVVLGQKNPRYVNTRHGSLKDIDGLVQERHNSIANALELRLSCTNPSIWLLIRADRVCSNQFNLFLYKIVRENPCPSIYIDIWLEENTNFKFKFLKIMPL